MKLNIKRCNNYFQLLCREIIEFLHNRGFPRQIWPAKYHERSERCFAGQQLVEEKMRILMHNHPFFSDGWLWVSFLGIFLWGIHAIIKNAIERKKCARTYAFLGTYAHFS